MTEDVVREALEKAADFIDQHNQCACDNPMQPAQDALTIFLKHILEVGPDRATAKWAFENGHSHVSNALFLQHLISRLEENTND